MLKSFQNLIDNGIKEYLNNYFGNPNTKAQKDLKDACIYATNSGKRIRGIFVILIFLEYSGQSKDYILLNKNDILKVAIAFEFIHAYSLVHDDLPSFDNDTLRRGQLTVWKKYGEYQAILVGDLLNTLTFELLSTLDDTKVAMKLIKLLSNSTGFYGMVGGQNEDMYFEKNSEELDLNILKGIHSKKTGALLKASIMAGGILAGLEEKKLINLEKLGDNIGVAFQLKDDLLDVEGTVEETGKSVGGEEKGYVYFDGLENTRNFLDKLTGESLNIINDFKIKEIEFIIKYIKDRKK